MPNKPNTFNVYSIFIDQKKISLDRESMTCLAAKYELNNEREDFTEYIIKHTQLSNCNLCNSIFLRIKKAAHRRCSDCSHLKLAQSYQIWGDTTI